MKQISVSGAKRANLGKKATKAVRREGLIPCNLYGLQKDANGNPEAIAFTISEKEANTLIFTPHPVKDNILHRDFLEVHEERPIVIGVPIQTKGLAEGVRAGGRLTTLIRKINVKALYQDIPEKLIIDVAHLQLGKSIKVGELSFDKLELVTPKEVNVVSVKMTRAAMSNATATAEAGA